MQVSELTAKSFPVVAGRVYEWRALLVAGAPVDRGMRWSEARLEFLTRTGLRVDPRVAGPDFQLPHLQPALLETLPARPDTDQLHDAALTSRFFIAPPDAAEVCVLFQEPQPEILALEMVPLGVDWVTDGCRVVEEVKNSARLRRQLLGVYLWSRAEIPRSDLIQTMPEEQIKSVQAQFDATGDWAATLAQLSTGAEAQDFETRVQRTSERRENKLTVAFVGSGRTYARLRCIADVVLLRESDWRERLVGVAPDLVLIETVAESLTGDWLEAFYSLTGVMPDAGRALWEFAGEHDIPVRLHVTAARQEMVFWKEALERADTVVVEGEREVWSDFSPVNAIVPRAAEPIATPALRTGTAEGTMLVPVVSDVFQYADFGAVVRSASCYATLFTEFHYAFVPHALAARLASNIDPMVTLESFHQRTQLLQESTIVLLRGESLRTDAELFDIILDAVSAGAIPVLFGRTRLSGPLVELLDRVWSEPELQEVQRLYRIPWFRERHWRNLFRTLNRYHVWGTTQREAVLGRDPYPASFDAPHISTIMVSKRPELIAACLETFRKQTWTNKTLILLINSDAPPDQWPEFADNERLFLLPGNWNVGRCLNAGIKESAGDYWTKMDDDDFYITAYLEELCYYYRATQADAVGRQSLFFFFSGRDETWDRKHLFGRCFRKLKKGSFVSGATLSAALKRDLPSFSTKYRNAVDSQWVNSLTMANKRIVCYDASSICVYRYRDESQHTWTLSGLVNWKPFSLVCDGRIYPLLENG